MPSRQQARIGSASKNDLRIALYYETAFNVLYESPKYQDEIVLPALFMARQFLELGLKYNIRLLKDISKSSNLVSCLDNTHDLKRLHSAFVEHYTLAKKNKNLTKLEDEKYLNNLKRFVDHIVVIDHKSMGARYSHDKDGNKMIDSKAEYDLSIIKSLLEDMSSFFSAIENIVIGIPE